MNAEIVLEGHGFAALLQTWIAATCVAGEISASPLNKKPTFLPLESNCADFMVVIPKFRFLFQLCHGYSEYFEMRIATESAKTKLTAAIRKLCLEQVRNSRLRVKDFEQRFKSHRIHFMICRTTFHSITNQALRGGEGERIKSPPVKYLLQVPTSFTASSSHCEEESIEGPRASNVSFQ